MSHNKELLRGLWVDHEEGATSERTAVDKIPKPSTRMPSNPETAQR